MSRRGLRRHNRRDANEKAIVEALEARGFSVTPISAPGVPDLLVGHRGGVDAFGTPTRRMWLIEVKAPKGKPTPAQIKWRERWTGPEPITVRTVEEALTFPARIPAVEQGKAERLREKRASS